MFKQQHLDFIEYACRADGVFGQVAGDIAATCSFGRLTGPGALLRGLQQPKTGSRCVKPVTVRSEMSIEMGKQRGGFGLVYAGAQIRLQAQEIQSRFKVNRGAKTPLAMIGIETESARVAFGSLGKKALQQGHGGRW